MRGQVALRSCGRSYLIPLFYFVEPPLFRAGHGKWYATMRVSCRGSLRSIPWTELGLTQYDSWKDSVPKYLE